jgi:uncharacterized protein
MIIKLDDLRLRETPLEVDAVFTNRELKVNSAVVTLDRSVHALMLVQLRGDCVRVKGSLETDVSLTCSRCAGSFARHLEKRFNLDYWPDPKTERESEEFELNYSELEIGFYRNDQIDLSSVVSEQVTLDIPMNPICREDCKGLCDQCGADLNEGPCSCDRTRIDPRLEALAELLKKKS